MTLNPTGSEMDEIEKASNGIGSKDFLGEEKERWNEWQPGTAHPQLLVGFSHP
jgi:hypothetical protein